MRIGRTGRGSALVAGLTAIFMMLSTGGASAQSWFPWDWGTESTQGGQGGGSGRSLISFPSTYAPGQIIVSFNDRRLYLVHRRGQAISYPIAAPRPQSRWQGGMRISRKMVNPPWTPTASMRAENPNLPSYVPGGHPRNPLGNRALYLGSSLYRIHGTDAPWTIGQSVSKGCIRMFNADVADLYNRVGVGTKVTVNWRNYQYASAY